MLTGLITVFSLLITASMTISADGPLLEISNKDFIISPEQLPTPSCHAATLVETSPGNLMAAWYGGSQEGASDVRIWGTQFRKGHWSKPVLLTESASDDEQEAHWNPVLFNSGDGLALHYKVGKSPATWRGYYRISDDQGSSWSPAHAHGEGFPGPVRNKPKVMPDQSIIYPASTEYQGWKTHFEVQEGQRWFRADVDDPALLGAIQPAILTASDGQLQALCRTQSGVIAQTFSGDYGRSWSALEPTELPNPNSAIDAITLRNGQHLLVYNPVMEGRTPLVVALSKDGVVWQQVVTLEDEEGEFSYPTVIEDSSGIIHIAYTWNRKAIGYVQLKLTDQNHGRHTIEY